MLYQFLDEYNFTNTKQTVIKKMVNLVNIYVHYGREDPQ